MSNDKNCIHLKFFMLNYLFNLCICLSPAARLRNMIATTFARNYSRVSGVLPA